jgi:hypothetical protein
MTAYGFASANPVRFADPTGLASEEVMFVASVTAIAVAGYIEALNVLRYQALALHSVPTALVLGVFAVELTHVLVEEMHAALAAENSECLLAIAIQKILQIILVSAVSVGAVILAEDIVEGVIASLHGTGAIGIVGAKLTVSLGWAISIDIMAHLTAMMINHAIGAVFEKDRFGCCAEHEEHEGGHE